MKVAVWDTYVTRKDRTIMHFDIIAPSGEKDSQIYGYGNEYLAQKAESGISLSATECQFCHIETPNAEMVEQIQQKGYYIYEMENCS